MNGMDGVGAPESSCSVEAARGRHREGPNGDFVISARVGKA
jgi:hypothetical protein